VYSSGLEEVSSERTRIERAFDANAVRAMKESAERDISVGGPGLASAAFEASLIDECHLFLNPVVVGGGNRSLPTGVRVSLQLLDEHRFANDVIHLHYRTT
jgi:riboflavin biosynthesis pyrimidine reductase